MSSSSSSSRTSDSEYEVERPPAILSLKDAAINTIVKNIGGYRHLITDKISPPMRRVLFEIVMARKREIGEDQVWAALPYLDQHRTTERFSTTDFASIFPLKGENGEIFGGCVSMEEFLQYLVEFVPNLRKLNIQDPRISYSYSFHEEFKFKETQLEPLATDLLLKLKNLTHVTIIGVFIKFSEFVRVCRESQNLVSIYASILIDIEPNSIKKILMTLDHKFDHQEYQTFNFPTKIGIRLKWANACAPYREGMVALSNNWHCLFPSLTKLQMMPMRYKGYRGGTQSERTRLLRILRREGRTLKTLCLHSIQPELNITFNHIFEHCNVLESLELSESSLGHDDPITSFGQLKNLNWHQTFNQDCTIRLDRILSAPLLQKIDIFVCKINLGDKESLLNQIRNRTILTQLTYIRISGLEEYDEGLNEIASQLRSLGVEEHIFDGLIRYDDMD